MPPPTAKRQTGKTNRLVRIRQLLHEIATTPAGSRNDKWGCRPCHCEEGECPTWQSKFKSVRNAHTAPVPYSLFTILYSLKRE